MNEHGRRFAWQGGYGAFSVSVSNTASWRNIPRSGKASSQVTFEQEYRALLKNTAIDPMLHDLVCRPASGLSFLALSVHRYAMVIISRLAGLGLVQFEESWAFRALRAPFSDKSGTEQ